MASRASCGYHEAEPEGFSPLAVCLDSFAAVAAGNDPFVNGSAAPTAAGRRDPEANDFVRDLFYRLSAEPSCRLLRDQYRRPSTRVGIGRFQRSAEGCLAEP